jgi:hypothetical protein
MKAPILLALHLSANFLIGTVQAADNEASTVKEKVCPRLDYQLGECQSNQMREGINFGLFLFK